MPWKTHAHACTSAENSMYGVTVCHASMEEWYSLVPGFLSFSTLAKKAEKGRVSSVRVLNLPIVVLR